MTDKAATAGNCATTAARSLSSSNFTSARRHRRLPSSDLKQASVSRPGGMANSPSATRNDNFVIEFPARDQQRRELMTSQQLRGRKVLLKNKTFVKLRD